MGILLYLLGATPPAYTTSDTSSAEDIVILITKIVLIIAFFVIVIKIFTLLSCLFRRKKTENPCPETLSESNDAENAENTYSPKKEIKKSIFVIISAVLVSCLTIFLSSNYDNFKNGYPPSITAAWERDVRSDEVTIKTNYRFPEDIVISITPDVDIKNLVIHIECRDTENNIIDVGSYSFGNVKAGITYQATIYLSELPSLLEIKYAYAEISHGKVFDP